MENPSLPYFLISRNMSQTLPMTIDDFHILKMLDNLHEKYAVDSKGDIYTYIEKVKDIHKKTQDRKLLNFHESIKSFTVYDEYGEACSLTLSHSLDVVITYPTALSPHKCVPYVSMRFF